MQLDTAVFLRALQNTRRRLMEERSPQGHWIGELATSALSTATAIVALSLVDAKAHEQFITRGLDWIAAHVNPDGGWGDTVLSKSNINTTCLCWAALAVAPERKGTYATAEAGAQRWITGQSGTLDRAHLVKTILAFYGDDRTFSTPILTLLTLTGRLGKREEGFSLIPALPFELAAAPPQWYKWLHLPVVSYALPALIAIGQVRHRYCPPWFWPLRLLRNALRRRTIRVLERMQPENGGFLEAIPLTSFVTACLGAMGMQEHIVVRRSVDFLTDRVRADGGWPIDTNLATWVTTLAVNALAAGPEMRNLLDEDSRKAIVRWLLKQQYTYVHPFTQADPGGWSWTDLAGAVPDADDTPGALIALHNLAPDDIAVKTAAARGVKWLLDLQNRDGGIPTFCRGWGKLPFDRSAQDMTAHTLAAWGRWRHSLPPDLTRRGNAAIPRAVAYLKKVQRPDGAWVPLWFGNQWIADDQNPTYGTARVLSALAACGEGDGDMISRGAQWLVKAQHADGSWGGGPGGQSSIEETSLALDALASLRHSSLITHHSSLHLALRRGLAWLISQTAEGRTFAPAPIGFYFAKLWYFEKLYPIVYALGAFEKYVHLAADPPTEPNSERLATGLRK